MKFEKNPAKVNLTKRKWGANGSNTAGILIRRDICEYEAFNSRFVLDHLAGTRVFYLTDDIVSDHDIASLISFKETGGRYD